MTARLITIPFSHFCEKARWALELCGVPYEEDPHLPIFAYLATKRAGATRTVPVLVDGDTIVKDSTDIIAWADAHRPATLLPADGVDRSDALALEDDFDRHLGPATRRWAYFHMVDRKDLVRFLLRDVPRWEAVGFRATRPLAVAFLKRGLKIDAAGAERSRTKIDETFHNVGSLLGDGRRYLLGDRFTVADLTFAALAAPVLFPPEYGVALPSPDELPGPARAQVETWRRSPPGQFALRLYAEHRHRGARATVTASA
ncbi:MAG TPA: glutathione S-transferase family protein [Kofleriaceae bacterium]|nr:glutathione S-transferase family protein [Kofleriaceae bacterium]